MYACVYSSMFVQGPRVTKQTQGEEGVFATLFGVVDFFFLFIFWSLLKKFTPRIGVPNTTPNKVTNKIVQHGTKKKGLTLLPPKLETTSVTQTGVTKNFTTPSPPPKTR